MQDNITNPDEKSNRWRKFFVGFIVWTIIGLSFGTRTYLTELRDGIASSWFKDAVDYLIDFYIWAAVSPIIFWVARRWPIERGHLFARIPFHIIFSLAFTYLVFIITVPAYYYLGYPNPALYPNLGAAYTRFMMSPSLLHQDLLIYWGTMIAAHAFSYYRKLQTEKMQAAELSAQLAQAQLAALKMQIHPHFLFNTLNSISALLHKDVEAADEMIVRLSDFLRLTLKNSSESVVTLAQEMEFLKTYLEIEKIRFQDRLVVKIHLEPDTDDALVPNLILQPLIENAVRHGVARQTNTGILNIEATRSNGRLQIKIEDNGPGPNESHRKKKDGGVGLANTRARLEQFYDDFQFEITGKQSGNGTVVKLDVPFMDEMK